MSLIQPPDQSAFDAEAIRRGGLHEFIRRSWSEVFPDKFVDNWHIGAMCEHLEACQRNQITRLIINVPPGVGKSATTCVFFPTWTWTRAPKTHFHFLSYDAQLSLRDSVLSRDLVNSDWYKARFPNIFIPPGHKAKALYKNNHGGKRLTVTLRGGSLGHHANIQVCDDPIKAKDTQGGAETTRTILKQVEDLWSGTLATRIADPKYFVRIIVMQRLHDADLCGVELSNGGYTHLMLPLRYEPKRACVTVTGFRDPRTEEGELLWPARQSETAAAQLEKDLGPFASAQLQQNPVPAVGGVFKGDWIRYWSLDGAIPGTVALPSPKEMGFKCQSWDMAFKGGTETDFVVGQAWGRSRGLFYLLDQCRARLDYPDTKAAVQRFTKKHPKIHAKLVEAKANGQAVVDDLKRDIPGFELLEPEGGKEVRAHAVAPLWKSGNVLLPHPSVPGFSWVREFTSELLRFPKGTHDDQVDAMTQALNWLAERSPMLTDAMNVVRAEVKAEEAKALMPAIVVIPDAAPQGLSANDLLSRFRGQSKLQ